MSGAAKHQEAEDCRLVAAEVEHGAAAVLVLGNAAIAVGCGEAKFFKGVQRLTDLVLGELEDGIAAGALVARVDQRVQGEGIVLRRSDLFFYERTEDSELNWVELHIYKVATALNGCQGTLILKG